jgi:CelD/BcsL family acetyltransferase involved in cellulose biosynthesis
LACGILIVQIERITTDAEIDRLVPEWKSLWERVPSATPFQSPQWLVPWWHCFGTTAPLILTARSDRELVGILPLYFFEEPGSRKLLPIGISLSDYLDALVDPRVPGTLESMLASLVEVRGWDECYLSELAPSAALLSAACPSELVEYRGSGEACPVLALPRIGERLSNFVPRKTLRYWRKAQSRSAAAGPTQFTQADVATVSAFMQELFRLHERRWLSVAERGVCAEAAVRDFHLSAAQGLLDAGMLRLYQLTLGDVPIAVYYGFAANGVAYAYLSGFDPDYAKLRAGTQVIGHAIQQAVSEKAHEFHFLRGAEAYKYTWGAMDRLNSTRTLRRKC